jgi:hypothetical protein
MTGNTLPLNKVRKTAFAGMIGPLWVISRYRRADPGCLLSLKADMRSSMPGAEKGCELTEAWRCR